MFGWAVIFVRRWIINCPRIRASIRNAPTVTTSAGVVIGECRVRGIEIRGWLTTLELCESCWTNSARNVWGQKSVCGEVFQILSFIYRRNLTGLSLNVTITIKIYITLLFMSFKAETLPRDQWKITYQPQVEQRMNYHSISIKIVAKLLCKKWPEQIK